MKSFKMKELSLFTIFFVFITVRSWVINNIDHETLKARILADFDNSIDKDDLLVPEERLSLIYPGKKNAMHSIYVILY